MTLPPDQARYHRQILLPGVGVEGQRLLGKRSVLIVGCGALGTVAAEMLVRAGVGRVNIVDRDVVELTNLQRQTLFSERDASEGLPKAEAAARRLREINSGVEIVPIVADVTPRNVERLLQSRASAGDGDSGDVLARIVECVVDGTDNFTTRFLLNDACVKHHVPLVYAGAVGTVGVTMSVLPGMGPCLRCVFPEPPAPGSQPTCDTAGVLGPVTGAIACLQAAEAIKALLGRFDAVSRSIREIDVWSAGVRRLDVSRNRDPDCVCCGRRCFEFLDAPFETQATLCGADAVQISASLDASAGLDLPLLRDRLSRHGEFALSAHMLRGRLGSEGLELTVFRDGRAIIRGTREPAKARAIYDRYVGS